MRIRLMRKLLRKKRKWAAPDMIRKFRDIESGASMVEYTILIGLISTSIIVALAFATDFIAERWQILSDAVSVVVW